MTFKELLNRLEEGKSFEEIENGAFNVECCNNDVFEDDDFYSYMKSLGVEDIDFSTGYAVFYIDNGEVYEIPYEVVDNRFDSELEDETYLIFEINRIYNVTDNYYYDSKLGCYYRK